VVGAASRVTAFRSHSAAIAAGTRGGLHTAGRRGSQAALQGPHEQAQRDEEAHGRGMSAFGEAWAAQRQAALAGAARCSWGHARSALRWPGRRLVNAGTLAARPVWKLISVISVRTQLH
jgi:hypothetical protein